MAAAVVQQAPQVAPVTRYQGVDKQSSGYKLLAAMGWREGEGLGASRQGIKEHIKVKKKFENWGVGAVEAAEKARDWTTGMMDFTRVLSTLSEITSQHAAARDSGYDSSSEDEQRSDASDGEVRRQRAARKAAAARAEAEGEADGKRKKKKKASKKGVLKKAEATEAEVEAPATGKKGSSSKSSKKQKATAETREVAVEGAAASAKKRKRAAATQPSRGGGSGSGSGSGSSDSESGSNAGSGSDSDGDAEMQQQQQQQQASTAAAAALAEPKRVKFATHVGRFKRREAAKMVKNYSSTDLAAILGGTTGRGPAAAAAAVDPTMDMVFPLAEVRAHRPAQSGSGSDSDGAAEEAQARSGSRGGVAAASGQTSGLACSEGAADAEGAAPALVPEDEGKWWGGYFARAAQRAGAGVGSSGQPAITIHGFREEDQENLYNLAQDGRTQGRVGLGRSSMPKKVAGTRWAGKKTKLGSDSEDEGQEEEEEEAETQQLGGSSGVVQQEQQAGEIHMGNGVVIVLPPSRRAELEAQLLRQAADRQQQPEQQPQEQQTCGGKRKPGKHKRKGQQEQQQGSAGGKEGAGAAAEIDGLAGLKWRKLVMGQLKAAGKAKLSVAKLSKAIVKERGLDKAARGRVEELVKEVVGASSKLRLEDGLVSMLA